MSDGCLLDVFIPGVPVPKERPRARVRYTATGSVPQIYTPKKTADWEATVEQHVRRAHRLAPPLTGRLIASATFWLPRPKKPIDTYPITARADLDNLVKALLDGAQRAEAFANDGLITDMTAAKRYADDEHPVGALLQLWAPM